MPINRRLDPPLKLETVQTFHSTISDPGTLNVFLLARRGGCVPDALGPRRPPDKPRAAWEDPWYTPQAAVKTRRYAQA